MRCLTSGRVLNVRVYGNHTQCVLFAHGRRAWAYFFVHALQKKKKHPWKQASTTPRTVQARAENSRWASRRSTLTMIVSRFVLGLAVQVLTKPPSNPYPSAPNWPPGAWQMMPTVVHMGPTRKKSRQPTTVLAGQTRRMITEGRGSLWRPQPAEPLTSMSDILATVMGHAAVPARPFTTTTHPKLCRTCAGCACRTPPRHAVVSRVEGEEIEN